MNLIVAAGLTVIGLLDVVISPFSEWKVGQKASASYRMPLTHNPIPEELRPEGSDESKRFITRYGQPVVEADLEDLNRLLPERKELDPRRASGVLALYFLALMFFNLVLRRAKSSLLLRFRLVGSVYLVLLVSVLASRLMLTYTHLSVHAIPIALCAILFTPLIGQNLAFVLHLLAVALVAPMIGVNRGVVLLPLVVGWTAVLLLDRESGTFRMILAALAGSVVGIVALMGLDLFTPQGIDFGIHLGGDMVGMAGGTILTGLVAGLLVNPISSMAGSVSAQRLRRLLEMDHPLLKDLADKAPGTFQHSLAVANMAEKIADDIGADSDLVRAGAYYHDIGKMKGPDFFIENQHGENPHDKLSPRESVSKLRSHIEAGITIARGANLPERIIDFLIEHHGRSSMEYFMDRAYQADGKVPAAEDFSYNGRDPASRETAILMIVDSIEAASRTLDDPSHEDIERLVRQIMFSKLLHGHLDNSGLSTGDIRQIGVSLIKYLQAQFHVRVTYPWQGKESERPPLQVVGDSHAGINLRVARPVTNQNRNGNQESSAESPPEAEGATAQTAPVEERPEDGISAEKEPPDEP